MKKLLVVVASILIPIYINFLMFGYVNFCEQLGWGALLSIAIAIFILFAP